jgi:poly(3-hydroxybutyrate) depolymerase
MLYHAYELNYAAVKPFRKLASFNKRLFSSPYNPSSYTPVGRGIAAMCDVFESMTRRYGKPEWHLHETVVNDCSVPVRDRVIWQKPFGRLIHFERDRSALEKAGAAGPHPRVLLVAPLSGHYATLLRRTVETFLPDHEVFVTEWADAREVPITLGKFDVNDFIDYVIDMLAVLGPDAHVVGVCQPGPLILAAVAIMSEEGHPDLPASMTLMGSPIDARRSPTVPNKLATERPLGWFKDNVIYTVPWPNKGVFRRVYPGFLQLSGFISMNQERHIEAHQDYFSHLIQGDCDSVQRHREFYNEYLAVMDLTEEFYLQCIRDVFQEFKLPKGIFMHHGRLVKPEKITRVALMTIEGEKDDISGVGQTQAAHDLCLNIPQEMQRDYIQPGVGHYGVFSGSRFRSEIQPRMRDFINAYTNIKTEKRLREERPHITSSL